MHANSAATQPSRTSAAGRAASPSAAASPAFLQEWRVHHDQAIRNLQNLARHNGSGTVRQRRRLLHSVVRHVNEGHFGLDEANDFLQTLGVEPARGPGRVSFRVPVALGMVHEDVETDIDTLEGLLESTDYGCVRWTRFDGCPGGYTIDRPSRPDPYTQRRRTLVHGELRLTVTVPAYPPSEHLDTVARRLLGDDLRRLQQDGIQILEHPTVWPDNVPDSDEPDVIDDEGPHHSDPGRSWRWRERLTDDDPHGGADGRWQAA